MRETINWILLSTLLSATALQLGCAAKQPISVPRPSFRLKSLNHESLLLTPAIPLNQADASAVKVILPAIGARPSIRANCSAESGPFGIEQENNEQASARITLPAPEKWVGALAGGLPQDGTDDVESLYAILAEADRLQQQGCFSDAGVSVRDFILQSVPMRPNESLFNSYGYRVERSSLDLKPGMRLKIERAYFRPPKTGEEEHAEENFLGTSSLYFDVELTSTGKIRFRQSGDVRYAPASLASNVEEGNRDLSLSRVPEERHYRLLFYTYLVPKQHRRSAAILGSSNVVQLDELDRQLRAQPDADSCKDNAPTNGVTCLVFDGFVTLSTQMKVELNGKPQFIDWGTKVKDVLSKTAQAKTPKSLKIQRQFMNAYYDVHFDPADPNILSLALVGGDRLTWSKRDQAHP
jgi:hypothetical protein